MNNYNIELQKQAKLKVTEYACPYAKHRKLRGEMGKQVAMPYYAREMPLAFLGYACVKAKSFSRFASSLRSATFLFFPP